MNILTDAPVELLDQLNVRWTSPSADSSGSMPLGNGEVGVNAWVEPNGDLLFYIARTDAWSHDLRLLKLGRVRIRLTPALLEGSPTFEQVLSLRDATMHVRATSGTRQVQVALWVDAHRPVIHVEVSASEPVAVEAALEVWRTAERRIEGKELESAYGLRSSPEPIVEYPDVVMPNQPGRVLWYHRNERSCFGLHMKCQGLSDFIATTADPLIHRTFGGVMQGPGMTSVDGHRLRSAAPATTHQVSITLHTAQTESVEHWLGQLSRVAAQAAATPTEQARADHAAWWAQFWRRSWVFIEGDEPARVVTRGYNLQRYITACAGRGAYPIKFNGSLFTVDGRNPQVLGDSVYDADYRLWGGHYWHQNTRLPYWSMLASGDHDMMAPFFRLYADALPLAEARTRKYFGHEGAFIPETMTIFGAYAQDDYGWQRDGRTDAQVPNGCIARHWQGALETAAVMLDYFAHTADHDFARGVLIPFADSVLRFYDQHFPRDAAGVLRMEPAQALETWQDAVNPTPDVAGLRFVLRGLLSLPVTLTGEAQRRDWTRQLEQTPAIPVTTLGERRRVYADRSTGVSGDDPRPVVLPAHETRGKPGNWENPELYTVFPYRAYQVGKPDLHVGQSTYEFRHELVPQPRWYVESFGSMHTGWTQDDIHAALLGLTAKAQRAVSQRFAIKDGGSRFPAFWGPNCDWIPDQDHGSVGLLAVQAMLLQAVGEKLHVLPAWPRDWDVSFKLHAPGRTTVECVYRHGKLERLEVTPTSRSADLVLPAL